MGGHPHAEPPVDRKSRSAAVGERDRISVSWVTNWPAYLEDRSPWREIGHSDWQMAVLIRKGTYTQGMACLGRHKRGR